MRRRLVARGPADTLVHRYMTAEGGAPRAPPRSRKKIVHRRLQSYPGTSKQVGHTEAQVVPNRITQKPHDDPGQNQPLPLP